MKKYLLTSVALLAAQGAYAGGLDRSGQSTAVLFEEGNYAEFSLGFVQPDITGTATVVNQSSGNVGVNYTQLSASYKWEYAGTPWSAAIVFDQPFGAAIDYPAGTSYPLRTTNAELSSNAVTLFGKYQINPNVSVFGGLRAQSLEAEASVPVVSGYTARGDTDYGFGYAVGGAYERKDIALRVALTYNSEVEHSLTTTEAGPASVTSTTNITTPQSVNLDFQTGVAADTLVFGSIRWANWDGVNITPTVYRSATGGSLVAYSNNTTTYTVGVGRRFSDTWSAAITATHEPSNGGISPNLGPTDGRTAVGLGATYTQGATKITGGVQYIMIGDADTIVSSTGPINGQFRDNTALAFGLKIGFSM